MTKKASATKEVGAPPPSSKPLAASLRLPTLVLNCHWKPIQTTTTRVAIGLVAKGSARIIDPVTYEVHDIDSWNTVSEAAQRYSEYRIRSQRLDLTPPEVILLTRYRGMGDQTVTFSRLNLYRRDQYSCQYCGAQPGSKELTIDHIIPRSRDGRSTWENCAVACVECNKKKAARTPAEAGMKLRKPAVRPSWSAISRFRHGEPCESWKKFLSEAYWKVELTDDV
ncbi:MAG: HNH endonuclease [Planctomycetota bacterium]